MRQEQEGDREHDVIRVLLIEDNETDYILTRELLEEVNPAHFDVHWISSYEQGLRDLCHGEYDVCLLDLRLGAHSGMDILLEANKTECSIPTILLTGFDTPEVDEQALQAQAADYLVKTGLTGRELARAISYAMERARAERTLRQSQQFLQSTLDSLSTHIAVLDESGTIVAVNEAWRRYAHQNGCIGGECDIGVNYLRVCEAADGPEEHEARLMGGGIRSVMAGGIPKFTFEYPCPSTERMQWFSVSVTRFSWDGPPHVVVAHEDVTHRRQAEVAMRASEARFRAAAEGSLDSFFILESVRNDEGALHDLRVVHCNARGITLLNRPLDEIVGRPLRALVPAEHIQGFIESCAEVIETRRTVEATNRVHVSEIYADWLHFQIVPLEDGVAVTIKDISEEKRALEALQKREHQLSEAQQIAHIGSWDVDSRAQIPTWSDESYRIYGLEPQSVELTVEKVFELIHPDDRAMVREIVMESKQNLKPFTLQHRLIRPDGSLRIVESRAEVVPGKGDVPLRMIGTMRDVTEQVHFERALRESQERLQAIITSVDMVIWSLDRNGVIILSEGRGLAAAGLQPGEVVGRSIFDLYPHGSPSAEAARRALSGEDVSVTLNTNGVHWETRYSPLRDQNGELVGATGVAIDISERLHAVEALRQAEEKYRSIFEHAVEGIFQSTPETGYISVNPALARIYGYDSPQDLISSVTDISQQLFVDPQRCSELLQTLNEEGSIRDVEAQVHRKDGTVIWISINARAIRDEAGNVKFYEGSVEDISQRKESEYRLHLEAFYDRLTKLPNRALFLNRLGHVLELAKRRENFYFAVLFLDFDGFKHINDSLGHVLGDELLIEIGRRLGVGLRPGDTVARLGGDEFTVLLEDIKDVASAIQVAERIHYEMSRPLHLAGHEVFPSVSIGIAFGSTNYDKAEDVLRDADTAMYRAKGRARGQYQVFDPSMHAHAVHRLNMEGDLRRAIESAEITPFYQPIVALNDGQLHGFEALVRWRHPERGLVAPIEFIAIAEETGLIIPLDERVRWLACRQLQQWQADYEHGHQWTMSVNVSRKTFSVTDLDTEVEHVLHMTQLRPQSLKVEITETTIVDNVAVAESTLRKLKERGVSLSMDDFGTGYSSLSYLHRFPLDTLKIDRSFVMRIVQGGESLEIVRAIITLAHTLNMAVVAEGVETAEQATLLRGLGCEYGQGYFFSAPVPPEAATHMLPFEYRWSW